MPNKKIWRKNGKICSIFKITLKRPKILKRRREKKPRREKLRILLENITDPSRFRLRTPSKLVHNSGIDCRKLSMTRTLV